MSEIEDEARIQQMIADGDIVEAEGNLWDLPAPTIAVKGKSATQELIDERNSY